MTNCFQYAKECEACQLYGPIQRTPTELLHPVIKPWPFREWHMDLIGKIYSISSKKIYIHHSGHYLLYQMGRSSYDDKHGT